MPVEVRWLVPNKIIDSRWSGDITAEDAEYLVQKLLNVFDAATTPIHSIVDIGESGHISPDFIRIYLESPAANHTRRGRIAIVGSSAQRHVLADLVNKVSQRELVRLFETRAAARAYLLEHDSPPPPLSSKSADTPPIRRISDQEYGDPGAEHHGSGADARPLV
ncbi:MAG: STAS/SEC14 domain-containing protein [Chloroflexi bacterium]|nr:STAS/SEC14 domain-containing protein [Chloroflexota bacterium]